MGRTLFRLFNLYPGEGKRIFLFLLLGFLWATGSYGTLVLTEGLFLEKIGAQGLLSCYIGIAFSLCCLSAILITALNFFSVTRLLAFVLAVTISLNAFFYFSLFFKTSITLTSEFWYLFKIIGNITPIATYISFWAFTDQYFDLPEAKRFYPLFNATLFLGDAFGGSLIATLIRPMGPSGLLFIFITLSLVSFPLILKIIKKNTALTTKASIPKQHSSFSNVVKIIFTSPFTLVLMLFYFVMQLLTVTSEFSYMDCFDKRFKGDAENSLTQFLGQCSVWISLGNTFFGLLLYSRAVKKLGINNMILIAPLFFFILFSCWASKELFLFAIIALIGREGMSYTFDDNNLLLLLSGVPAKVKNQVRIMIEAFFEPVAMLCCVALLVLFNDKHRLLGLLLSAAGLFIVAFLRSHYPKAIFQNLIDTTIRWEKKSAEWLSSFSSGEKKKLESYLFIQLRKGEEDTKLLAFEYLLKLENEKHIPRLLNLSDKLSLPSKLKVAELLTTSSFSREIRVIRHLEKWKRKIHLSRSEL